MKSIWSALVLILAVPALASSQDLDLGSDLSAYRRFLVYPHLHKASESMQRGERDRALAELEQARRLAPESATVALHLAAGYRKFGETGRAEAVLREQLTRTPGDARLQAALIDLRTPVQTAALPSSTGSCSDSRAPSCGETSTPAASRRGGSASPTPDTRPAPYELRARVATSRESSSRTDRRRPPTSREITSPNVSNELRDVFMRSLEARRFKIAEQQAEWLLPQNASGARLFDEVTYKLVEAGAIEEATRILLRAYPFASVESAERDTFLHRLGMLIEQQRNAVPPGQLVALRHPLDTPSLRSRQAAVWAGLHDCSAVRMVLGDLSPEYRYDDWMRLGDCSLEDDPPLAEQAYARAHAIQPGGRGSRAVAYSAYARGDYRAAFAVWQTVNPDHLSGDHLIAAATTAIAATEYEQAATWLAQYRESGGTLNHPYWSLLGQSYGDRDPAAAIKALERAVEVRADVDDYLRLARLQSAADRQVHWLERATDVDPDNAGVQLQLAYAYSRAGRAESALSALERSARLDPDNMNVQVELGFAHWRAGHPALARRALERAWRADPSNLVLAQQLVYVAQRLKQNDVSRWFARQVLDAPEVVEAANHNDVAAAAERRFGFQRLHEDLGRRVTVNLDGFSGTRVGTAPSARRAERGYRSYSQLEADVRLGSPAVRNGSTLSAYARVFADGGEQRGLLPSENAMVGMGVRWKPFGSQIVYLAAENQTGLEDHRRTDVLLRASASFFNGGRHSDDWHPSRGWVSRNLYLDAARYLKTDYNAFTADYRTSYHRKMASKQTLEPYGHLQFTGAWEQQFNRDIRAGLGMRWNIWYGATKYDAERHKLSLGVEFQQAFETYLPDHSGVFVTLGSRW